MDAIREAKGCLECNVRSAGSAGDLLISKIQLRLAVWLINEEIKRQESARRLLENHRSSALQLGSDGNGKNDRRFYEGVRYGLKLALQHFPEPEAYDEGRIIRELADRYGYQGLVEMERSLDKTIERNTAKATEQ